jgi:two-component system nitrogen regulation sensor histidine kinase NtrY
MLFFCSLLSARWFSGIWIKPLIKIFNALINRVDSYRDNDFSTSLNIERSDEFAELFKAHNQLGELLREQRQSIFQRELMLDTVIQNSPQVMLLTDDRGRVLYANFAARKFFSDGRRLEHLKFSDLLVDCSEILTEIIENKQSGLFTLGEESNEPETWHHAYTKFELNSRFHHLYLIKHLTREINREEVKVWKKLIRVISHELNNSLAPICSLAHSGEKLLDKGETGRLKTILHTIAERSDYLNEFIDSYATFARLPTPNLKKVQWKEYLDSLMLLEEFKLSTSLSQEYGVFDPVQMQQVLINLLKNAQEAGGDTSKVQLIVIQNAQGIEITVKDRGDGMSENVLSNALLPFYSTKRSGSGIGLSLSREITEAHRGKISLANRHQGGLSITLRLPELQL